MDVAFVNPPGVHAPAGQYSHLARIDLPGGGTLLFVSGQVALDEQGKIVGKGDVTEQADQVYVNLKQVLASQGATFRDIVTMTVFVTEMAIGGRSATCGRAISAMRPPIHLRGGVGARARRSAGRGRVRRRHPMTRAHSSGV